MAKSKAEQLITQSLIDRLIDTDIWPSTRERSISMFRESLKRDIEWLLNTRQPVIENIESYPHVAESVFNFGLPNLQSFDGSPGREQNALTAVLERCIRSFESRIKHPRVFLVRSDTLNRSMKFLIEGEISYESMQEEIKFDTVLELLSGEYEVK